MTREELKDRGAIFFEKITEGLNEYQDLKLVMDQKRAQAHFAGLKKEYGADNAFADFYYFCLDEDAREMVNEELTPEEISYLQLIRPLDDPEEEIIFPLDDKLLKIIVKLNAGEVLFSTIYFLDGGSRKRTTWWGNYDKEYICFRDKA